MNSDVSFGIFVLARTIGRSHQVDVTVPLQSRVVSRPFASGNRSCVLVNNERVVPKARVIPEGVR